MQRRNISWRGSCRSAHFQATRGGACSEGPLPAILGFLWHLPCKGKSMQPLVPCPCLCSPSGCQHPCRASFWLARHGPTAQQSLVGLMVGKEEQAR